MAAYFEATAKACGQPKLVANWLMGEVAKRLNTEGLEINLAPVAPSTLAVLIARIQDGTISNNAAKQVFDVLWSGKIGLAPGVSDQSIVDAIIESKGLKQMNDSSALEKIIDDVLATNAKNIEEFRAGKDKAFNALVGQVMKASKGQANPAQVNELLKRKLT
jgi:aspartyl-tRNA(Asn)/glutamyl-tRNA(Gln) amidotransferase subunit B